MKKSFITFGPGVGPDLGPNCLQRLSTDETGRQRVTGQSRYYAPIGVHESHSRYTWDAH